VLAAATVCLAGIAGLSLHRAARSAGLLAPEASGVPTAVWIDERIPTRLLARYQHDRPPGVFHEFPASIREVTDVTRLRLDESGPAIVVAGLSRALPGGSVVAFDHTGRELWHLDMSSALQWPDCAKPTMWNCTELAASNVDGEPGDELIVVASDLYEYPTRISIVDPRTRAFRATFWHMGDLSGVEVVPDFFGPGHPALLAHGINNKLDGFAQPRPDDPPPLTAFEMVPVAMVLDPRSMDGIGPPDTSRIAGIPPARPWAYALLDTPVDERERVEVTSRRGPGGAPIAEAVSLVEFACGSYDVPGENGPWLVASLSRPDGRGPGSLVLDRDLEIVQMVASTGETAAGTPAYWRRYWIPVIQGGVRTERLRSGEAAGMEQR
jgi:hypothetical protein